MIRGSARALLLLVGASVAVGWFSAPVVAAGPEVPADRRVLVISVPGLRWDDLDRPEMRTLRALLDESAVANLATRVTGVVAEPGEAYLTLGAGTRAVAEPLLAGLAYEADESIGVGTAAEEYARQQGLRLDPEGAAVLSWPLLVEENAGAEFDATLGALGQTLADASVPRGVVGNADTDDPLVIREPRRRRELVAALADESGSVPCSAVGTELLREDPGAPFGVHLDQEVVAAAVARCATAGSVVLVEASDLRRATAFRDRSTAPIADAARRDALVRTDALVAALLADVDTERDAVVVVSPTTDPDPGLGVLGIRAETFPAGLLTSGSTRRPGYVLLTDLAPSIATLAGVEMDEASLEGRDVQVELDGRSAAERRHHLVDAEAAAVFRDEQLDPVVIAYLAGVSVLALVASVTFVRGWRRAEPWLEQVALVLVAFPTWTYLAALLPFHDLGVGAYWAFLVGGSLALGLLARSLRRSWLRPILLTYGAVVGVVVLSVVLLGSRLQLSTVFGDSPIVAGRFSGINNVTFALFVGAAIVLACAIVHLVPPPRARQLMVGFLVAVLLVDVAPMWGADVGGALAGLPALALVATGLGRWKVRWRTVAITALATLALVVVLGLLDLTRAPADRSHLGRLFERIASDGIGGLTIVVERKLTVNLRSLTTSTWRYLFGPLALAAGLMAWRGRQRVRSVATALPALRHATPGFAAAAVLGYAANDSGVAVPSAMLALVVPGLVYLACRVGPDAEATGVSAGVLAFGLLLAGGVLAALLLERAAAPVLGAPALRRLNHRGRELATAGGLVIVLAVLVVEAARTTLAEFGVGEELSDSLLRSMVLFACFAFAFLGLIDDLLGTEDDRGFRGHLRALGQGRLTTGAMKLFGGGVVAIVLTAAPGDVSGRRLLADAALVALAANLGNLLDRAPGRTIKVGLVAYVPIALAAGTSPVGLALAPVVGATAGLLPADLDERLMLGDTGANLLGAVLGLAVVLETSRPVRTGVLVALILLNAASERVSFTKVIDATPGLRHLDRLGRRPLDP